MTTSHANPTWNRAARRGGGLAALVARVLVPGLAHGHGESVRGIGGVGINTTGGEIVRGFGLSTRYDLRQYSLFSDRELAAWQELGENVHQHAREQTLLLGFSAAWGERWDLTLLLQANRFSDFTDNGDAYALETGELSRTDVSQGLGDMLAVGRVRLVARKDHHLAAIGGLKLPTGNVRQRTNNGEIVGTHNQPSSGSVDFQLGLAYTAHLADRIGITADAIARINTQGAKQFRSGNSVQADLAIGYRPHAVFVPSIELNAIFQQQDIEGDEVKRNSGIASVFVTPAVRVRVRRHALSAGVSYPLWQKFPGISNDELVRVSVGYGVTLGRMTEEPATKARRERRRMHRRAHST
jgi:hypothetical protein